jgi:hypothetical protein
MKTHQCTDYRGSFDDRQGTGAAQAVGKDNRARRAAKAKKRQQKQAGRSGASGTHQGRYTPPSGGAPYWDEPPPISEEDRIGDLFETAMDALYREDQQLVDSTIARLARSPKRLVVRDAETELIRLAAVHWGYGWQPRELVRQIRRTDRAPGERLIEAAIIADHAPRSRASLDDEWAAQVDEIASHGVPKGEGWLLKWAEGESLGFTAMVSAIVSVLFNLRILPKLEELIPPPGGKPRKRSLTEERFEFDPVLERVRALLAQAESTTFEAEAEAFTAKAQTLMTRHAIDLAMVTNAERDRGKGPKATPESIRLPIDDPYADTKSFLLQVVAQASRCRSVFLVRLSVTTVIGFPHDLVATEMLFTSLLVQAQAALAAAAKSAPPGSRTRSRSFRSSFLMGYANRVGERLDEVNRHIIDAAEEETGSSILPVLADQADQLDEVVRRMFPGAASFATRGGNDHFGYWEGRRAADVAKFNLADLSNPADSSPGQAAGAIAPAAPD